MAFRNLILATILVGAAAGGAGSLAFAGRGGDAIAALGDRVGGAGARPRKALQVKPVAILANAPPLFPVQSGPNAARDVALRLEGVARSPGRTAALLSVDGGPAGWLQLGETRDGVTLQEVGAASATVDTPRGPQVVKLGAAGASSAGPGAPPPAGGDGPPPGFHALEPASAPGTAP